MVQPPGPPPQVSPLEAGTSPEPSRLGKEREHEIAENLSPKEKSDRPYKKPISDTLAQDRVPDEPSASNQPISDDQKISGDAVVEAENHHKKSEDAVAAAKARFLARKKAKV